MNMDMCTCAECNVSFKVSDCTAVFGNHNGWEMPPYYEHYCPNCGGLIEDYFYSDDVLKELNSIKDGQV